VADQPFGTVRPGERGVDAHQGREVRGQVGERLAGGAHRGVGGARVRPVTAAGEQIDGAVAAVEQSVDPVHAGRERQRLRVLPGEVLVGEDRADLYRVQAQLGG
jgi:hypothetical protein